MQKKRNPNILIFVIAVIIILLTALGIYYIQSFNVETEASLTNKPIEFQLRNLQWKYSLIFKKSDIPLPKSAQNAKILSIYSPTVVSINKTYYMFFGVSIYCNGIYRDSIAMATSSNSTTWKFSKYAVQPDSKTCNTKTSLWPTKMVYQTNGPHAQIIKDNGKERIFLFYDNAQWNWPKSGVECNNVGLAIFDEKGNRIARNDDYLSSNVQNGKYCYGIHTGFKSPAVQWLSDTNTKLWFDTYGNIGNVPINNLWILNPSTITNITQFAGADVELPYLSKSEDLIIYGYGDSSGNLLARTKLKNSETWGAPWYLFNKSGAKWDSYRQGSPNLFLNKINCTIQVFYSGDDGSQKNTDVGVNLSIGVATPKEAKFKFTECN